MKNKVIRGVLAAACVTTAVSAANVFGAGTEQSLVNEASAVTQEETEETTSAQAESPAQKTITAAEETAAAKAEDIQPEKTADTSATSAENSFPENTEAAAEKEKTVIVDLNKSPEDMNVDELQQAILAKMAGNGPVTDQMKKTVYDNIWHDSLVNWLKSFH
mgnify:CR=1 FL=1